MRVLDLFCGRWGWSKAFAARWHECVGIDLTVPPEIPEGCTFIQADVLTITAEWIREQGFDFICASSPCEQFSVHGMKHFHPNPPYPALGLKLFNHTREICEASGLPYVMENVRAAQQFVGRSVHHCGPFHLWGTGVPLLMPQGISKTKWTMNSKVGRDKPGNQCPEFFINKKERASKLALIPPELANCVCDYAEFVVDKSDIKEVAENRQEPLLPAS